MVGEKKELIDPELMGPSHFPTTVAAASPLDTGIHPQACGHSRDTSNVASGNMTVFKVQTSEIPHRTEILLLSSQLRPPL